MPQHPPLDSGNDGRLRKRIRARLASAQLRSYDGMIVLPRDGIARLCAACILPLEPNDSALSYGYRYRDDLDQDRMYHWSHIRCAAIWEEERKSTK
jgi:hypothetical protein